MCRTNQTATFGSEHLLLAVHQRWSSASWRSVLRVEIFADKLLSWTITVCKFLFHAQIVRAVLSLSFINVHLSCNSTAVRTRFLTWWISPPFSFFIGKAFFVERHPTHLTSTQPCKHVQSPFGPQRRSLSVLQTYRKCSDMTARVITQWREPPICRAWKDPNKRKGEGKGFPALFEGDEPIFQPPFLRNHQF